MPSRKLTKSELEEISGASASVEVAKDDYAEEMSVDIDTLARELLKPEKKKRGRKKKENYVDPEVFKNQIVTFYKTNLLTNDLGKAIHDIANRLGFMPNFINYTYKEEMVGDAIEKMLKALWNKKYEVEKGNPFSYYTKIAFNAFCNRIKKEKRNREALLGYQTEVYESLINTGNIPDDNMDSHDEHGETKYDD